MNKHTFNIGGISFLAAAIYFIYYLLLHDKALPFSISTVLSSISYWARDWHVLVVGLLPIYIALMIFGTAVLGVYLGSAVQRWITQRIDQD